MNRGGKKGTVCGDKLGWKERGKRGTVCGGKLGWKEGGKKGTVCVVVSWGGKREGREGASNSVHY